MIISEKNIFYYLYLVQMTGVALIWRALHTLRKQCISLNANFQMILMQRTNIITDMLILTREKNAFILVICR